MFDVNLAEIFSYNAVVQTLQNMAPVKSKILDTYYPESVRGTHPLPTIGIDEITDVIGCVPVVRRGSPSTPLAGDSGQISYIEPQPFNPSSFISAAKLNDLKILLAMKGKNGNPVEQWRQSKLDRLRKTVRKSTDALAAQSLDGAISYPMKVAGGALDTYSVTFGSIQSHTITTKWENAAKKISDILKDFIDIAALLEAKGYGANIRWEAGITAFMALANIVTSLTAKDRIVATVNENSITVGGFTIHLVSGSYIKPGDGTTTTAYLGAKYIRAIDMDAPFMLKYCAIDDVDANLVALPFFPKVVKSDDPSGYKIIGQSTPLPIPVPNAIVKALAITE